MLATKRCNNIGLWQDGFGRHLDFKSQILEEFTWHPTEERILVKDAFSNGVKNYTVYYVSKDYLVIENSSGNYAEKYVYQGNDLVAQVNTNGNKEFIALALLFRYFSLNLSA